MTNLTTSQKITHDQNHQDHSQTHIRLGEHSHSFYRKRLISLIHKSSLTSIRINSLIGKVSKQHDYQFTEKELHVTSRTRRMINLTHRRNAN